MFSLVFAPFYSTQSPQQHANLKDKTRESAKASLSLWLVCAEPFNKGTSLATCSSHCPVYKIPFVSFLFWLAQAIKPRPPLPQHVSVSPSCLYWVAFSCSTHACLAKQCNARLSHLIGWALFSSLFLSFHCFLVFFCTFTMAGYCPHLWGCSPH